MTAGARPGVRRRTVALLGALALASTTALAACSTGSADEPTPSPKPTRTAPAGPTLITFSVYGPPPVITAYTKIAADFSAKHPDIVVNIKPYDSHDEEVGAIAAGNGSDVFMAELRDLPAFAADKRIQPVDRLMAQQGVDFGDGYQREALEAFSADASLQCMPVDISPLVVYYNTRLVDLTKVVDQGEAAPTPDSGWNLDEFSTAARQSSHGKVKGLYVAPNLEQVAPFVWSGGGQLVDDEEHPTTLTLSDPSSLKSLEPLLELVRDPAVTFNQQQLEKVPAVKRFKAGRLGMILGYRDLTPVLRQQQNLQFDVMPLPRQGTRATGGQMSGMCLSAKTKNAEAAAQFMAYAVSDDATVLLASTGYVTPTNLDVANSDAFLQPDQQPNSAQVFTKGTRYIQEPPSAAPGWPEVAALAQRMLTRLFYDPVVDPLEQHLAAIDERSAGIFARYAPPSEKPSPSPSESPSASPDESPGESPSSSPAG